jgi:O-antigen repeat unit transporter
MQSLEKRFAKGLGWGLIDNFSGTGINFLVGILLARQLTPEIFGLVGIALVVVTISLVLSDGGFSNALIRKHEISEKDYSTVFVLNMGAALFVYAVLFFTAPLIASFNGSEVLIPVIRILGTNVIFASSVVVLKVRLTKQLDFRTQAVASLSSGVVSAAVGVWMVFNDYGIWSLVAQQLLRQLLYAVVLWLLVRSFPKIDYSSDSARELFGFGSRILFSSLLTNLYNNLYYFLISKVYTPRKLGLYTRADQFSSLIAMNFAFVLQRVSFPVLTECSTDLSKLTKAYRKLLITSAFFGSLFFFSLCAAADHFIVVLIGEKWLEAVPILRILALSAVFQPLVVLHQNILQVFGHGKLFLRLEIVRILFSVLVISVGVYLGFVYMLWGLVIAGIFSFCLYGYFGGLNLLDFALPWQIRSLLPSLCGSALLALSIYLVGLPMSSNLLALAVQLILFLCGAGVLMFYVFPEQGQQILTVVNRKRTQVS